MNRPRLCRKVRAHLKSQGDTGGNAGKGRPITDIKPDMKRREAVQMSNAGGTLERNGSGHFCKCPMCGETDPMPAWFCVARLFKAAALGKPCPHSVEGHARHKCES